MTVMCPSCGDAMYPNWLAEIYGDDVWHCYARDCGALVWFKRRFWIFQKRQIQHLTFHPEYVTLDEELEQTAKQLMGLKH